MAQTQEVTCSGCTATLRVPDKYWGKKVRCPKCSDVIAVPAAARQTVATVPAAPSVDDVEFLDDEEDFTDDEYDDVPAPPKQKKSRNAKSGRSNGKADAGGGAFGMEKKMLGSGVLGGLGLMAVAVVWFVAGLFADRIFFYPPVLFIIGLVSFVKGLIGKE